jgi:hypothetical protein
MLFNQIDSKMAFLSQNGSKKCLLFRIVVGLCIAKFSAVSIIKF